METRRLTHTYKLIKSSWGVRISITATVQLADQPASPASASPISMSWSGTAAELPPEYKAELALGLARCEAAIADEVEAGQVLIDVEQVAFVESDFQMDGLSVAMCRWAEEAFELAPRQIEETFDRVENKYLFEWA